MRTSGQLLNSILATAREAGLDQAALARAARLSPESISRAKRRPSMDLSTLSALADAAGMEIQVVPKQPHPSPLAHPSWGLAWSNPDHISTIALIQGALLKGNFALVLEACAAHGLDRVQAEWAALRQDAERPLSPALVAHVNRQLANIAKGTSLAST